MKTTQKTTAKVFTYTKNATFKPLSLFLKKAFKDSKKPIVVSHGSRTERCCDRVRKVTESNGIVINHPDAIRKASDKYICKQLMDKIAVETTKYQLVSEEFKLKYPIVAKLRKGFGGTGMVFIKNAEEREAFENENRSNLDNYFYEQQFNPRKYLKNHFLTTQEFRIHYSPDLLNKKVSYTTTDEAGEEVTIERQNGVIFMVKKVFRDQNLENCKFGKNITTGNAYFTRHFTIPVDNRVFTQILTEIDNLVKGLGLNYAAVDILICKSKKDWCILEVNTAPGFADSEDSETLRHYMKALETIITLKQH